MLNVVYFMGKLQPGTSKRKHTTNWWKLICTHDNEKPIEISVTFCPKLGRTETNLTCFYTSLFSFFIDYRHIRLRDIKIIFAVNVPPVTKGFGEPSPLPGTMSGTPQRGLFISSTVGSSSLPDSVNPLNFWNALKKKQKFSYKTLIRLST